MRNSISERIKRLRFVILSLLLVLVFSVANAGAEECVEVIDEEGDSEMVCSPTKQPQPDETPQAQPPPSPQAQPSPPPQGLLEPLEGSFAGFTFLGDFNEKEKLYPFSSTLKPDVLNAALFEAIKRVNNPNIKLITEKLSVKSLKSLLRSNNPRTRSWIMNLETN